MENQNQNKNNTQNQQTPDNNNHQNQGNNQGNAIKNPEDWKTGDEPMTGAQSSYLHTLASEAHENVDEEFTKAEAAKKIEELQKKTGRGTHAADSYEQPV